MRKTLRTLLVALPIAGLSAIVGAQQTSSQPPSSTQSIVPLERTVAEVDTVDRVVAVVGHEAVTWNELVTAVNQQRAQGLQMPNDSAGQMKIVHDVLDQIIDADLLVQKAHELKIDVPDDQVQQAVNKQLHNRRAQFKDEIEFRAQLKDAGFGSVDDYRNYLTDAMRRYFLQQKVFIELRKNAKPASVSDSEVSAAFERARPQLQHRPPLITFRQIVVTPKPSPHADSVALAKADSLLAAIKKGADFAELAKKESMDPGSKDNGGDLGWQRRGVFVPEFERVVFALRPGQIGPIVKTQYGYHIIRVDRVRPGEVKARHILIAPQLDSADVTRAYDLADSVAKLWRNGADYDSLVAKYHDRSEEKAALNPQIIDSLPEAYQQGLKNVSAGQVSEPFELKTQNGQVKFAVAEVLTRTGLGEYSLPEVQQQLRDQLAAEKQSRQILDDLRKQTYVSIRF
jgi:peptidyl-prolyl cis-trans isomerase SurA